MFPVATTRLCSEWLLLHSNYALEPNKRKWDTLLLTWTCWNFFHKWLKNSFFKIMIDVRNMSWICYPGDNHWRKLIHSLPLTSLPLRFLIQAVTYSLFFLFHLLSFPRPWRYSTFFLKHTPTLRCLAFSCWEHLCLTLTAYSQGQGDRPEWLHSWAHGMKRDRFADRKRCVCVWWMCVYNSSNSTQPMGVSSCI